jgi:hypothetical protein
VLPYFYHDPAADLAFDNTPPGGDHIVKPDLADHGGNLRAIEIARKALPRLLPQWQGAHDGINAEQRDAA